MNVSTKTQHLLTRTRRGYFYAALIVIIWTGFILISRVGGKSSLTSWDLVALRYATAAIILLPVWWCRCRINLLQSKTALLATLGGLCYAILSFTGFKLIPAAHASILLPGLLPFTIAIAAWFLMGEVPSVGRTMGLGMIALGVTSLASSVLEPDSGALLGEFLMVGASLCWAWYTVLLRRMQVSPWDATIAVTLLTAIVYLPVYLLVLPKHWEASTWPNIVMQAIYQGFVASIVQMLLYVRATELIGSARLGMLMALVPVFAGIAAVPLLNESLSPWVLFGLALVGLGAWLGNR